METSTLFPRRLEKLKFLLRSIEGVAFLTRDIGNYLCLIEASTADHYSTTRLQYSVVKIFKNLYKLVVRRLQVHEIKYIHTYVRWIPWTISWWGYRGSMKCDFSCSPPLWWLPHLLLLFNVTLPRSLLGSRHWTKIFLEDETTNLQEQPRSAKWCCAMTFLVDERVIVHYYAWYPLANQESHCTASFHASWLFLQICCFIF